MTLQRSLIVSLSILQRLGLANLINKTYLMLKVLLSSSFLQQPSRSVCYRTQRTCHSYELWCYRIIFTEPASLTYQQPEWPSGKASHLYGNAKIAGSIPALGILFHFCSRRRTQGFLLLAQANPLSNEDPSHSQSSRSRLWIDAITEGQASVSF